MADIRYIHLIKKIVGLNDEKAFEALFEHFYNKLHEFSVTFTKSTVMADEIVMDVFMNIWKRRQELYNISNLDTYLYIAVRNHSLNMVKKESRFRFDPFDNIHINLGNHELNPEYKYISKEMLTKLNQAINQLPSQCKMIFKLIREDGLSRTEVAQIMGLSPKTIDNQVAIAVKKISEILNLEFSVTNNRLRFVHFFNIF